MAYKILVLDESKYEDGDKMLTLLTGSVKDEGLYAEFHGYEGEPDVIELATHINDIVKIRDFCNKLISKIGPAGDYTSDNILIKLEGN